ncbi:MAG: aldo/keto reductase, partial [Sphingomicrobium sp.]
MRTRPFGKTGLSVSELTFGTSALERGGEEAQAALVLALHHGINAVEIGAGGAAEDIVGDILRQEPVRGPVHVFSRASSLVRFDLPSPHIPAYEAYPGSHLCGETEASLKRLGVERLGCLMLHTWCPEWLEEGDWLETLVRLRDEGKIAAIGVSLFDHDLDSGAQVVASGAIDCIEFMFNIFDQGAGSSMLPHCDRHGVAAIVRSPLYYGALSSQFAARGPFADEDWRGAYFYDEHRAETGQRVAEVGKLATALDQSISDLAIRYAISHPAVTTVAVGMSSRTQVEANVRAVGSGGLEAEAIAKLRRHRWLC